MYQFVDQPVTGLDDGGRFLVWSMRSWVESSSARTCPANRLAPPFAHWQMLSGLQPFLRMMALFNRYGLTHISFCELRCNHVSEHEAIVLSLMRCLRDEQPDRLHGTLEMLVDEDGICGLIEAMSQLGKAMGAAGIFPKHPAAGAPGGNAGLSGHAGA